MKLYRCLWPNGDVSLVTAKNKLEAIDALDEVGSAAPDDLDVVRWPLAIHLEPTIIDDGEGKDCGTWELGAEAFNEWAIDRHGPLSSDLALARARYQSQEKVTCLPCKGKGLAPGKTPDDDEPAGAWRCKGCDGRGFRLANEDCPKK